VALLVAIHLALHPVTIPTIVLSGLAGAVVYIVIYLLMPATESERALARRVLAAGRAALAR